MTKSELPDSDIYGLIFDPQNTFPGRATDFRLGPIVVGYLRTVPDEEANNELRRIREEGRYGIDGHKVLLVWKKRASR